MTGADFFLGTKHPLETRLSPHGNQSRRSGCHPERSAAESKDLRLFFVAAPFRSIMPNRHPLIDFWRRPRSLYSTEIH